MKVLNKSFDGIDNKYRGHLAASSWTLCVGAGVSFGLVPTWYELTKMLSMMHSGGLALLTTLIKSLKVLNGHWTRYFKVHQTNLKWKVLKMMSFIIY
ncbi:hypothetical protein L1D56_11920 [Vibrio diabolicus]|uniref:hypothetical protein n=1 Tax=Vibrio diabolicus TaxID=50719 RepID=UPI00211B0323|nr:hypothetical protein [Vibrio diabolicus]MCG9620688.1 hypothetical protein [Vibrio diabolicus]